VGGLLELNIDANLRAGRYGFLGFIVTAGKL